MEAITLGGLFIVVFGMWVEYEAQIMSLVKSATKLSRLLISRETAYQRQPVYAGRMSVSTFTTKHAVVVQRG